MSWAFFVGELLIQGSDFQIDITKNFLALSKLFSLYVPEVFSSSKPNKWRSIFILGDTSFTSIFLKNGRVAIQNFPPNLYVGRNVLLRNVSALPGRKKYNILIHDG